MVWINLSSIKQVRGPPLKKGGLKKVCFSNVSFLGFSRKEVRGIRPKSKQGGPRIYTEAFFCGFPAIGGAFYIYFT